MKTLAKDTWHIAGQNWKHILLFEFFYRGLILPAVLRVFHRGLYLALHLAGYSYLTAGNIGSFLVRPWTILILLGVGFIFMVLLSIEAAGLITAFQGSAYYQKLTPLHMFLGGVQKVSEEICRKNWRLGIVVVLQYFLINLIFIGRMMTHMKPVNFLLHEMANQPWTLALTASLLVLCIVAAIPRMFLCYGCMIEQKSFRDSLIRSEHLLKSHRWHVIRLLAGINLLMVLITVAAYLVSVFAAAVFIVLFTKQNLAMAVLLTAADRLEVGCLFAGSILAAAGNYAALSVAYYQYGNRRFHEERWDFENPMKSALGRRQTAAVFGILVVIGLFYIFDMVRSGATVSEELLNMTEITAHRGSSRTAPENTAAAMAAAIDELADSAELDVQLSADGIVVLGHDANLKRVAGVNRPMSSMTYEELSKLDVGSWFSAEYAGEKIPALNEILELCKGRLILNIELKNLGKNSELPLKTAELIIEHGMEEQCVITSTSLAYLKEIKELVPQLQTGYIISAAYGNFYSSEAVDFISVRSSFVDSRLVENVHEQGKGVYAWTVNSKSEMERLVMLGVDGIITDQPVLAREIIYREEATETLFEYLKLVFR